MDAWGGRRGGAGTEAAGVDKDGGDALFCSETSRQKKKAIIADLLQRDVRYQPQWRRRRLFVFVGEGVAVREVSISSFQRWESGASLFSPCLSSSPAVVYLLRCLSSCWRCKYTARPAALPLVSCTAFSAAAASSSFFVCQEIVDMAINKEQPQGGQINSATLGL